MHHKKRGLCLIFDHETFDPKLQLETRTGTKVDRKALKSTMRNLGFKVRVYKDCSLLRINKILEKVADLDHTNADCLAITVLSHGDEGILYAYDNFYDLPFLWSKFTGDKCPSLAGKPKLFFIQVSIFPNFFLS